VFNRFLVLEPLPGADAVQSLRNHDAIGTCLKHNDERQCIPNRPTFCCCRHVVGSWSSQQDQHGVAKEKYHHGNVDDAQFGQHVQPKKNGDLQTQRPANTATSIF
jgi:hypothetical protein